MKRFASYLTLSSGVLLSLTATAQTPKPTTPAAHPVKEAAKEVAKDVKETAKDVKETVKEAAASVVVDKELGTRKKPLQVSMVPSSDATKIMSGLNDVRKCLEEETGYFYDTSVPNNYIVVVENFGSKKTDIAFLATFGYLLANERYGAEALLKSSRHGETTYKGQFIARVDNKNKINKIEDLAGRKVAFVDPASTSGYILAKKVLNDKKIKPSDEVFAGKHDNVVTMVYQGQVDAGATFYSPPDKDKNPGDARKNVKTSFPDVFEKIKIIGFTEDIPNDPIVVRKDLPTEMKTKIREGFMKCVAKPNLVASFEGINNSDGLAPVKDSDYDALRKTIKDMKIDLGAELSKKKK